MTDLRQAAQAVVDRWDSLSWSWSEKTPTADLIAALRIALEQPEQEPVAWQYKTVEAGVFVSDQHPPDVEVWNDIEWSKPLYTTPPTAQRPWVGLTDDEIDIIYQGAGKHDLLNARDIEAALKERNT